MFRAGQIASNLDQWKTLTTDREILNTVEGQTIEFIVQPIQVKPPYQPQWANEKTKFMDSEILALLEKGIIEHAVRDKNEFISTIFLRPKKDGNYRMILNLKSLNHYVKYQHFKMDSIATAIEMVTPGCFMASIDLKDAYYSVAIANQDRKYLKFLWRDRLYQFTCFPNGLAFCPRKFTKLLKPAYATLRQMGHLSVSYIDDSYLQADTYEKCVTNIIDTITLFNNLGFTVHPDKSILVPTQQLVFLGFVIDSKSMTVSLTPEKACKVKNHCQSLFAQSTPSIREVAKVLGLLTSSFPGVMFGPLHCRWLEIDKTQALRDNKGNFDAPMKLTQKACDDLQWWINNIQTASNPIGHGVSKLTMTTDASKIGWGCNLEGTSTGGCWTPIEAEHHINYLETKAVLLGLQSFQTKIAGGSLNILIDNTTAVACINQMGTCHSTLINSLVIDIWESCIKHNIWLTASHIAGVDNTIADLESRKTRRETEWSLNPNIFHKAVEAIGLTPDIDLFASRLNYKCEKYISYQPDPGAFAINAFHIPWERYSFYAFPPFCIIQKVLRKIQADKATGIIVVPHWPTQAWWPYLMRMLIAAPLILPRNRDTLILPSNPHLLHPLHKTLNLLLCRLSGDSSLVKDFQEQLPMSLSTHGNLGPRNSTSHTYNVGKSTVIDNKYIHFQHLS